MFIVLAGVVFRVGQYAHNRSYWHDEAFLVLNVIEKPAANLLGALDFLPGVPQSAPPVFLLLQRAIYVLFGDSEFSLRLVPLASSIFALALFVPLARRTLSPLGGVVAVGMLALSTKAIWHSAEAKQYSGDLLVATALLLAAFSNRPACSTRRFAVVCLLASALLWFSQPAVFMFAGIALAFFPAARPGRWVLLCLVPGLSFGILYFTSIRLQESPIFYQYWADDLADWSRWWMFPYWFVRQTITTCEYTYRNGGWAVAPLAIVGGIHLWRTGQRRLLIACAGAFGMVLLAAMLRRYPYGGGRVNLFLAPALLLLCGAGIQWLAHRLDRRRTIAIVAILLAIGGVQCMYHLFIPQTRTHIRPVIADLRQHRDPETPVYVLTVAEFLCYWRPLDHNIHMVVRVPTEDELPERYWVIASYSPKRGLDELQAKLKPWPPATPVKTLEHPGGAAILFQRPENPH